MTLGIIAPDRVQLPLRVGAIAAVAFSQRGSRSKCERSRTQ